MNRHIIALLFSALLPFSTVHALDKGDAAADCTLTSIGEGQPYSLRQFQGKVLYIDFWASWCGPCAKSFPFLNGLNTKLKDRGLQVIAVNLDENAEDAKGFLTEFSPNFTVAADGNQQCAQSFNVKAMPSSYLVDRKGIIRHVQLGFKAGEGEQLEQILTQLLDESPNP